MYVASILGLKRRRRKLDRLVLGSESPHTVKCSNDNGADLYVSIKIICKGPYLSTPTGKEWSSPEMHLADRRSHGKRSCTFNSRLIAQDHEDGEIRPVEETVEIEVFWRRLAWPKPRFLGKLEHTVEVI